MKPLITATLILTLATGLASPIAAETIRQNLRCESRDFSSRRCALPLPPRRAEIEDVRLLRQLSSKPCIEGRSWFVDDAAIIVQNGCRGEFQVVFETRRGFDRDDRYHPGDRRWDRPDRFQVDPNDIVMRSFAEVLHRHPSREELRYYRSMILDRGWSEHDIRRDLREDRNKGRW